MHLSNLFLQNMFCEMQKTFKNVWIEACLASMMHAPSSHALCFVLWDLCALVHLAHFKTKLVLLLVHAKYLYSVFDSIALFILFRQVQV